MMEHNANAEMSIGQQINEIGGVVNYGWLEDGAGSIEVELGAAFTQKDVIDLHKLANRNGYNVVLLSEEDAGSVIFALEVQD